jgi:hypothetical protein
MTPVRLLAAIGIAVAVVSSCGTGSRPVLVAPPVTSTTTTTTTALAASTTTTTPEPQPSAPDGRSHPAVPADPRAIAESLVAVERALRDEATPASELPDLGHTQQVLYRVLGRNPEWDPVVFGVVPSDLESDVRSHIDARRAFIDLVADIDPPENVPAWAIVEPEPLEALVGYYREAEAATGIEWEYLAAINLVETGMGRIVGLSTAGARGPMQFIPSTWDEVGEGSIDDPRDSIHAAARYLVRRGGPDDMNRALWGYNNADEYVAAVNAYADLMRRDERNLVGLYHWEIHYFAAIGDLWLPVGYRQEEPIAASAYVAGSPWSVSPPPTGSG